ncbi:protein-lysine N-methyltransferase SMYD4 [Lasioglossum baleicum]|uniref:protein-lysine N-methyltransferase SMYD4 n=1 Tax=Lasioglossum baleicum TaxID=434251 RepID=UPI003FCDE69B
MEKVILALNVKLRAADMIQQVTLEFQRLCTDEERIKYTLSLMSDYDIIPEVHYDLKNDKKSEELRTQANRIFVSSPLTHYNCIDALKLYTQSIANAPCSSKQLAISYANRSAVLYKLRKYEESIKDIDRALALPYPDNLKFKVNTRRTACLEGLQKQKYSDNIDKSKLPDELCPFKIKTYNSEIPCASDAISLRYSKDYGRHVVAARDIEIGETIILEKAYSTLLSSKKLHTHCSHCLKVCWANIPCNSCTYAMYCSEECRAEEWEKYHDVECAVYPSLLNMDFLKMDLLALRIAVQAVRQSSIDALRKELVEVDGHNDPRTKGFSENGTFESDQYRSLLSLVTNTEKRSVSDLTRRSLDSCFILYFLATCTNMFGTPLENNLSLLRSNPDVTFFGGLLLRHEQMIPSNCHTAMELVGLDVVERGVFALPFCSLINHSCNPNITRVSQNKEEALIAIYPIKSGKQIFDNYGQLYALSPKADRQKKLEEQYKFICDCLTCREDWPLYYNMKSCLISVKNSCNQMTIVKALRKIDYYVDALSECNVADNPHMLFDLLAMVKLLYEMVPMPCAEMNMVLEAVKRIYDLQGNTFELPLL